MSEPIAPALPSEPVEPINPYIADRVPCGRCGEVQARGNYACVRCGVRDPEAAEPLPPRKPFFGVIGVPMLPVTIAVLGTLAVGALTVYTRSVDESRRRQRVVDALGGRASDEAVAEVAREASQIGVSTDVVLRIRFACLGRESRRPSLADLREARVHAEAQGAPVEAAVVAAATDACGP